MKNFRQITVVISKMGTSTLASRFSIEILVQKPTIESRSIESIGLESISYTLDELQ